MHVCLKIPLYVCQTLSQNIWLLLCKQSYDLRGLERLAIKIKSWDRSTANLLIQRTWTGQCVRTQDLQVLYFTKFLLKQSIVFT